MELCLLQFQWNPQRFRKNNGHQEPPSAKGVSDALRSRVQGRVEKIEGENSEEEVWGKGAIGTPWRKRTRRLGLEAGGPGDGAARCREDPGWSALEGTRWGLDYLPEDVLQSQPSVERVTLQ